MSDDRIGEWFLDGLNGTQLWPCDVRPEDLDIQVVAWGLAHANRFQGQAGTYSVAQHSVLVARQVPPEHRLVALLHDGPEAYLGDVVRPLKRSAEMKGYRSLERMAWGAFCQRFGFTYFPPEVKEADSRMLITERRDLLPPRPWQWQEDEAALQPYAFTIRRWAPRRAFNVFIGDFLKYGGWP